jgi:hypothetical protein
LMIAMPMKMKRMMKAAQFRARAPRCVRR